MDKVTGLGMTLKEYRQEHGEVNIADAVAEASSRLAGAVRSRHELGELKIESNELFSEEGAICAVDEFSWGLFAKLLNIPLPYLLRMGSKMRALNANYWMQLASDKEVELLIKDFELLDIKDGMVVEKNDVLELLDEAVPGGMIINSVNQANSVTWDVIDQRRRLQAERGNWCPGMRVVVKEGLNAPDITPIFMSEDSCGVIDCAEYFEKLNIKSLSYNDILHVISERMTDCINSFDCLFDAYRKIETEHVPNTKRRIALYCRENNVPGRVGKRAVDVYDDSNFARGDFGDIISVFSTLGFTEEVKPASEKKLQRLAGHIVTKAHSESRCEKCDALSVEA